MRIAAFERTLLSRISTFLARLDLSRDLADDVAQELREELLVPGNASAGIFQAALASFSSRERLYLRLHYADGLDIDRIGRLYKIHRSTVARRLAEYRRKLRESMQERLRERLKLTDSEFDSVLLLVRSQLVVSLRSTLKKAAHPAMGASAPRGASGRNTDRLG